MRRLLRLSQQLSIPHIDLSSQRLLRCRPIANDPKQTRRSAYRREVEICQGERAHVFKAPTVFC